jgi:hypothetical protein
MNDGANARSAAAAVHNQTELNDRAMRGRGVDPMDLIESAVVGLVAMTILWVYINLRDRIAFLEHEVRWLRSELNSLKPTESGSER